MSIEAFKKYRSTLVANILGHPDYPVIKASGRFGRFIQSEESVEVMTATRFIQLGTEYTKEIDVGRGKTINPSKKSDWITTSLLDWVKLKKYNITFKDDEEAESIAWAIAKNMAKEGSYKRRPENKSKRTNIIRDALAKSQPTLLQAIGGEWKAQIDSEVKESIESINAIKS